MDAVFLKILNMSITAGWLVLGIVVLRLILKRAPKFIAAALWALVGFRLILPVSFESDLSLLPSKEFIPEETVYSHSTANPKGAELLDFIENNPVSYELTVKDGSLTFSEFTAPDTDYVNPLRIFTYVGAGVWAAGMIALLLYTLISCIRIRRRVREAVPEAKGIYRCDRIETPFIYGFFRPKIYLPSDLDATDAEYVIAHEKAHLKRLDHWWKPLGFLLLTVYWFHPLLWVAYLLLCRDIELACDEKVLKELGTGIKKDYSNALIHCSVSRKTVAACPLAFGEVGVKQRVKSVLSYKKPTLWILIAAAVLSAALAVAFLTDPKRNLTEEVTPSTTFSDVSVKVLSVELGDKTSTMLVRIRNDNDEPITYDDKMQLLRWQDSEWKTWMFNGIYEQSSSTYLLEPGDSAVREISWATADVSTPGKYRIAFIFELFDNWDAKTEQLVERFQSAYFDFTIDEDLEIRNYTHFLEQGYVRLHINGVTKRFSLLYHDRILEEGVLNKISHPGFLVLNCDSGKTFFFHVTSGRVVFLSRHSDPMPDEIINSLNGRILSFQHQGPEYAELLWPSNYSYKMYRIPSEEKFSTELWLNSLATDLGGTFLIWKRPLIDGGYDSVIQGRYKANEEGIVCIADDGREIRFTWSEIKNLEHRGEDGYYPLRYPIPEAGAESFGFFPGEELTSITK